jgi:hypothetical protein
MDGYSPAVLATISGECQSTIPGADYPSQRRELAARQRGEQETRRTERETQRRLLPQVSKHGPICRTSTPARLRNRNTSLHDDCTSSATSVYKRSLYFHDKMTRKSRRKMAHSTFKKCSRKRKEP